MNTAITTINLPLGDPMIIGRSALRLFLMLIQAKSKLETLEQLQQEDDSISPTKSVINEISKLQEQLAGMLQKTVCNSVWPYCDAVNKLSKKNNSNVTEEVKYAEAPQFATNNNNVEEIVEKFMSNHATKALLSKETVEQQIDFLLTVIIESLQYYSQAAIIKNIIDYKINVMIEEKTDEEYICLFKEVAALIAEPATTLYNSILQFKLFDFSKVSQPLVVLENLHDIANIFDKAMELLINQIKFFTAISHYINTPRPLMTITRSKMLNRAQQQTRSYYSYVLDAVLGYKEQVRRKCREQFQTIQGRHYLLVKEELVRFRSCFVSEIKKIYADVSKASLVNAQYFNFLPDAKEIFRQRIKECVVTTVFEYCNEFKVPGERTVFGSQQETYSRYGDWTNLATESANKLEPLTYLTTLGLIKHTIADERLAKAFEEARKGCCNYFSKYQEMVTIKQLPGRKKALVFRQQKIPKNFAGDLMQLAQAIRPMEYFLMLVYFTAYGKVEKLTVYDLLIYQATKQLLLQVNTDISHHFQIKLQPYYAILVKLIKVFNQTMLMELKESNSELFCCLTNCDEKSSTELLETPLQPLNCERRLNFFIPSLPAVDEMANANLMDGDSKDDKIYTPSGMNF